MAGNDIYALKDAVENLGVAESILAMNIAGVTKTTQKQVLADRDSTAGKFLNRIETEKKMLATKADTVAINANTVATTKNISTTRALGSMLIGTLASPVGIAVALVGAITAITLATKAYEKQIKETIDKSKELVSNYQENMQSISGNMQNIADFSDDYKQLAKGVDELGRNVSLTEDEFKQYHEITSQIANMFPQMVQGYDEQGNAILRNKGNVDLLTEALREQQRVANQNLLNEGGVLFQGIKNESNAVQGDINKITEALKILKGEITGVDVETKKLLESKGIELELGTMSLSDKDYANANYVLKSLEDQTKLQEVIKTLTQEQSSLINKQKDIYARATPVVQAYLNESFTYDGLNDQQKNIASMLANALDISSFNYDNNAMQDFILSNILIPIKENRGDVQQAISDLLALDINGVSADEYRRQIDELLKFISDTLNMDSDKVKIALGVEADYTKVTSTLDYLKNEIEERLYESLKDLTIEDLEIACRIINDGGDYSFEDLLVEIDKVKAESPIILEFDSTALEEAQSEYEGVIKSLNELKALQADIAKNGITQSNLDTIIRQYPDLIAYMGDTLRLQEELNNKITEQEDIAKDTHRKILENSNAFYNEMLLGNTALVNNLKNNYDTDLRSFTSLAQAKIDVDTQCIAKLSKMWAEYFNALDNSLTVMTAESFANRPNGDASGIAMAGSAELAELMKKQSQIKKEAERAKSLMDDVANKALSNMGSAIGSGISSGSSGGGGSSASKDDGLSKIISNLSQKTDEIDYQITILKEKLSLAELVGDNENIAKINAELNELFNFKPTILKDNERELEVLKETYKTEENLLAIQKALNDNSKNYYSSVNTAMEHSISLVQARYDQEKNGIEKTISYIEHLSKTIPDNTEQMLEQNLKLVDLYSLELSNRLNTKNALLSIEGVTANSKVVQDVEKEIQKIEEQRFELRLKNIDLQFNIDTTLLDKTDTLKKQLESALTIADLESNVNLRLKVNNQIKDVTTEQIRETNSLIKKYSELRDTTVEGSKEHIAYTDKINSLLDKQSGLINNQITLNKELAKVYAEQSVYGSQGKEVWEESQNAEIKSLEEQIKALQNLNKEKDKQAEIEKKILEIQELEMKLAELHANQDTQILTKDEAGGWNWDYIADYQKVQEAEQDINDKRLELEEIYEEERKQAQIDALQEQIDLLKQEIEDRNKSYDTMYKNKLDHDNKMLAQTQKALAEENTKTKDGLSTIVRTTSSLLDNLYGTYSSGLSSILSTVSSYVENILDELSRIPDEFSSGIGGGVSYYGSPYAYSSYQSPMSPMSLKGVEGFKTGGLNVQTGLQLLHGTQNKPERVLSAEQTKSFDELVKFLPKFDKIREDIESKIDAINSVTNISNENNQPYIENMNINLPNVDNAKDFSREFSKEVKHMVVGLSQKAGLRQAK